MSRYIDADELIKAIETELWDWETVDGIKSSTVLKQTISDIKNMPVADVVEVVRCKDCIHWLKDNKPSNKPKYRLCEYYRGYKNQDGFCDFGERKETK